MIEYRRVSKVLALSFEDVPYDCVETMRSVQSIRVLEPESASFNWIVMGYSPISGTIFNGCETWSTITPARPIN
jgi:hypothetical protein